MKYIKKVIAWFNARKADKVKAAKEYTARMVEERVQLREFKSGIYIAIDGIPVVSVSSHVKEAIPALEEARQTFLSYINLSK